MNRPTALEVAEKLAQLYDRQFGGKPNGRYRLSPKALRTLAGRRKLPEQFKRDLGDELLELGYVIVDLEAFYAVVSVQTFASYRRLSEATIASVDNSTKDRTKH